MLNEMNALGTLSVGTRHGRTVAVYRSMNILNEARNMSEFVGYPFPLPLKDPPGQRFSYLELPEFPETPGDVSALVTVINISDELHRIQGAFRQLLT